jgi:hypothetical protein
MSSRPIASRTVGALVILAVQALARTASSCTVRASRTFVASCVDNVRGD